MGEAPLGLWNSIALIEARDSADAVPDWLRTMRHVPVPDDVLQIRDDVLPVRALAHDGPPPQAGVVHGTARCWSW